MKTLPNKFYLFIAFLFGTLDGIAGSGPKPPPPPPNAKATATMFGPPPPEGLPIDENIFILIIIALIFGIYIIYGHRLKTKTPI
jgi:hypothetical protein